MVQSPHDLRAGIVAAVCARFDLPWHGRLAAAYIEADCDCFLIRDLSSTCGLYPDQLARAHHAGFLHLQSVAVGTSSAAQDGNNDGDVDSSVAPRALDDTAFSHHQCSELHTAIHEYLTAAAEDRKPDLALFQSTCFKRMAEGIARYTRHSSRYLTNDVLTPGLARTLLQEPNWEEVVTMCTAWAFPDNVAFRIGSNAYRTTLPNTVPLRAQVLPQTEDFQDVTVTQTSLRHELNACSEDRKLPVRRWIVFTNMLRFPHVGGVVPLPDDIAAMRTAHPLTWPSSCPRESILQGFRIFCPVIL